MNMTEVVEKCVELQEIHLKNATFTVYYTVSLSLMIKLQHILSVSWQNVFNRRKGPLEVGAPKSGPGENGSCR
jgi:hypothetical protein